MMAAIPNKKTMANRGTMKINIGATVAVRSSATDTAGPIKAVSLTPLTAVKVECDAVATPPPPMIAIAHSRNGFMSPINETVNNIPTKAATGVEINFMNEPTAGI